MKRKMFIILFIGTMFLIILGLSNRGFAEVNVNVGINLPPPPPLVIHAPPPMFVIPRTYVYFAPEVDIELFFYHDHWYRPYRGYWYRSGTYNGKWVYISSEKMPPVLLNLPPDYRRVPPGHQHIPHGQLKKNWKKWEKEKYWEKHGGKEWHGEKWEHDKGGGKSKGKHKD